MELLARPGEVQQEEVELLAVLGKVQQGDSGAPSWAWRGPAGR